MLVNVSDPEESRIAIMDGDRLEEIHIERASSVGHVGNIYKGKVVNIEPSIQAAFVDIGEGRNGFLHVSDVMPVYAVNKTNGKPRHRERKIQDLLVKGTEVLVQITKEGIGNKAPTLTTYLSIPGRYVVLMPSIKRCGVSRKIEDENLRRKLRNTLTELNPPEGMGYIVRTAGAETTKRELSRDLDMLLSNWKVISRRARHSVSPALIYQEWDILTRILRDIFTEEIEEIIVDDQEVYKKALDFMGLLSSRYEKRVKFYQANIPLFYKYSVEAQIEKIYEKKVFLKCGGHIVIEQTEALVAIDVNSGKCTGEKDIEKTALRINLEAAQEIALQLRLRDLGGVIVSDFIDMKELRNRQNVERLFRECIRKDRARSRVGRLSQFGLIEMTRQRLGPSIKSYTHDTCTNCNGLGLIKSLESMSLTVLNKVKLGALSGKVKKVSAMVSPDVALDLANRKRKILHELEQQTGVEITINPCDTYLPQEINVQYFDRNKQAVLL